MKGLLVNCHVLMVFVFLGTTACLRLETGVFRQRSRPFFRASTAIYWGEKDDDRQVENDGGFSFSKPAKKSSPKTTPPKSSSWTRNPSRNSSRGSEGKSFSPRRSQYNTKTSKNDPTKINLRELDTLGYTHIYGIAPVLNALASCRRDFSPDEILSTYDDDLPEKTLPSPRLFVQESTLATKSSRSASKSQAAESIKSLAASLAIPTTVIDKGTLNAMSNDRPHQGFVLRSRKMNFDPTPDAKVFSAPSDPASPNLWLALDSVVDPQNFGAILRSAYFMGGEGAEIGVLVCGKNSAPPTPVVSAASAGALEVSDVVSVGNMPKALSSGM